MKAGRPPWLPAFAFCAAVLGVVLARDARAQADRVLFDFRPPFDVNSVTKVDAQVQLSGAAAGGLEVTFGTQSAKPTITIKGTAWDLSGFVEVAMDITNLGSEGVILHADVSVQGRYPNNESVAWIDPGETETLVIVLYRSTPPAYMGSHFTEMKGLPGGYVSGWAIVDLARADTVRIWRQTRATSPHPVRIANVRATYPYALPTEQELESSFFPMIDTYGQYMHRSWPGKTTSQADIDAQRESEKADLAAHPGPSGRNKYGGYLAGPALEATGHFRAEKVEDKWWLVDPEGRLFWSFGVDCVGSWQSTTITGREKYFTTIPQNGDFRAANVQRKFGTNWATWSAAFRELSHARLRSWGMNSIGNWSDSGVYLQAKTPYVVFLSSGMPKAAPATLDATEFRATVATRITADAVKNTANDPMCIGYFVDNELDWPAAPDEVASTYYQAVREQLKTVAPNKLYLGSRIHSGGEGVYRAAAASCDVVGVNRYSFVVSDFALPSGIDKPVIIGEFHFGALDRGLAHTGLRSVGSQRQRARVFADYVRQALAHPQIVGAQWFQLSDQMYTGHSGDGENYQIGFVDIVDRPYPEMVEAARAVGDGLYDYRMNGRPIATPGRDAGAADAATPAYDAGAGGSTASGGAGGRTAGAGGSTASGGAGGQTAAAGGAALGVGGAAGGGGAPTTGTGGSETRPGSTTGSGCSCRTAGGSAGFPVVLLALGCILALRRSKGRRPHARNV